MRLRNTVAAVFAAGLVLGPLAGSAVADSVRITQDSVRITQDSVRITQDSVRITGER